MRTHLKIFIIAFTEVMKTETGRYRTHPTRLSGHGLEGLSLLSIFVFTFSQSALGS